MQKAPEIVVGIGFKPEELLEHLAIAALLCGKLRLLETSVKEGAIKIQLKTFGRYGCTFDVGITYDDDEKLCNLHFTPVNLEGSPMLSNAVAIVIRALVNHLLRLQKMKYRNPQLEVTDGDLEKVATFLEQHSMSTIDEISNTLRMIQYKVAISLMLLIDSGIAGCTDPHITPRRHFLK